MRTGVQREQAVRDDNPTFDHLAPNIIEDAHEHWRRSFCGPHCMCDECAYKRALACAGEPLELTAVDRSSAVYRAAFRAAEAIVAQEERARRMRVVDHVAREMLHGRPI
ncbi:MAG: hypothetical protein GIX03_04600 [Candidatus Eremiobacteraeota bacterium]|nr:hypothetical protein [Candidatus Eremiobacteraeota bacterium]MBC5802278.1 hypothetical protein [Candidatus Eremiobacteraeota bacterium]MBC5822165.1 hypothetical protein [Candidatus Eremiobacteraeota bacterium]